MILKQQKMYRNIWINLIYIVQALKNKNKRQNASITLFSSVFFFCFFVLFAKEPDKDVENTQNIDWEL